MSLTENEVAILKTVVYFDIFDYPLTLSELWRNLPSSQEKYPDLYLFKQAIEKSNYLKQIINVKSGFYFLRGRDMILGIRDNRYRASLKKIQKAKRIVRILRCVPFIRSIVIGNSLGYFNTRPESDIDFLILAEKGSLWIVRGLAIVLTEIFASRPKMPKIKDTICLSFFSCQNYNFKDLRLLPEDPYFDWWAANLLPIYDYQNSFAEFFKKNDWIIDVRPNAIVVATPKRLIVTPLNEVIRRLIAICLSWPSRHLIEVFFERLQKFCLPSAIKKVSRDGTAVVMSDDILKFHLNDRRAYFREELEKRLNQLCPT